MQFNIKNFLKLVILTIFMSANSFAAAEPEMVEGSALPPEGLAEEIKSNISVVSAVAKPSLAGSNNSAAYISLKNDNDKDVVIISAKAKTGSKRSSSTIANRTEMHLVATDDRGVSKMVPVNRLLIPANSTLTMKPGGIHIMLLNLKKPLAYEDKFFVDFVIENVGLMQVEVTVGNI